MCTPASCVLTLEGTGALLVPDGTSSLVTTSQSVSQNSPPATMVNQRALPVTPDHKAKISVSRGPSSAHGQERQRKRGVFNNRHQKCRSARTLSKRGRTSDQMTPHANVNKDIPRRRTATRTSPAAFLRPPIAQGLGSVRGALRLRRAGHPPPTTTPT